MDDQKQSVDIKYLSDERIAKKLLNAFDSIADALIQEIGKDITNDNLYHIINEAVDPPLLHVAAENNNMKIVNRLVTDLKADPAKSISHGWTAMDQAISNNNTQMVEILMKNTSDQSLFNRYSMMYNVTFHGNLKIMKILLNREKKYGECSFAWNKFINQRKRDSGYTTWHSVCEKGHLDCIKYLLSIENDYNVEIDKLSKTTLENFRWNALHAAVYCQEDETTQFLLKQVYLNLANVS